LDVYSYWAGVVMAAAMVAMVAVVAVVMVVMLGGGGRTYGDRHPGKLNRALGVAGTPSSPSPSLKGSIP